MAKDRDGLHKRQGGIWKFRYRGQDGRTHIRSSHKTSYQEAKEERLRFLGELRAGQLPNDLARWTVQQALDSWKQYRQAGLRLAPETIAFDRYCSLPLSRALGGIRLEELTIHHIRRYQTRRRLDVCAQTVNREVDILIQLLKQAKLWHRLEDDHRSLPVVRRKLRRVLESREEERLFRVASQRDEWQVAYNCAVLARNTGMRACEIKGLRVGSIDLKGARLAIERDHTKTDAGQRDIPLNRDALTAVRLLLQRHKDICDVINPNHYLLPGYLSRHTKPGDQHHGRRGFDPTQHQKTWRTAWRSLREVAGLPRLRFHDLRHHFATTLADNGVDIEVARSLMGHMSIEMTRYYTEIRSNRKQEAVKAIEPARPVLVQEEAS